MWRNSATESGKNRERFCAAPSKECAKHPAGQGCWHYTRSCSYYDQKRAFTGTSGDGPLSFKMPRGACNLFLSEPGYEWSKPIGVANWHHELRIKIDGDECRACSIVQGGGAYIQSVHVDLARHGSTERCASARVSLSVQPVESLAAWEASSGNKVCQVARETASASPRATSAATRSAAPRTAWRTARRRARSKPLRSRATMARSAPT